MKTYSKLLLAFLLLTFFVPQVAADEPPEDEPLVEYYENGKKMYEYHFKDGKEDGRQTQWDKNGRKWSEEHYKNGEPDGLMTVWHENGKKWFEVYYKNGKLVSREEFDKNGRKH